MAENLEAGLRKLGLEDKEAKVYLAALKLGPSPVQKIAQRAGVPRATTYLVLDDLQNKGLVTTYQEGKKTYFVASSPEQLAELVSKKSQEVKDQQQLIKKLVPDLTSLGQFKQSDQPTVRYYSGPSGWRSYFRDLFTAPGKEVLTMICHEDLQLLLDRAHISLDEIALMRKRQKIGRRLIVAWKKLPVKKGIHSRGPGLQLQVPYRQFPIEADIDIKGDYVGFMPYSEPIRCVLIRDRSIANAMRVLFRHAWEGLIAEGFLPGNGS